jgi:LacI family transcriptional regulator, galactose operon repressor
MVTIKDIAHACGVSMNTVSRAINDKPDISEKTKIKIRKYADEVGFVPNSNARGMSSNKRFVIGFIFGLTLEPVALSQLVSIIQQAQTSGYGTICQTLVEGHEKSFDECRKLVENIIAHNPEGIVMDAQLVNGHKDKIIEFITKKGIPLVLINADPTVENCNAIIRDTGEAAKISTEFFINKDFDQFAYVGWAQGSGKHIKDGYMRALQKNNKKFNPECLIDTFDYSNNETKVDYLREKINALLDNSGKFGVFCTSFWLAAVVEKIVLEKGLSVSQDDICIISLGHDPLNTVLHTPILCCKTNVEEIGLKSIEFIKEERNKGILNIYKQKWEII